jgi:hypothetical protein
MIDENGANLNTGETYEEFVEKFKPKKTTDDCYTPPEIYEVIKNWACAEYGIDPASIVRPFYPGGDFENYQYPDGCTVLDNPTFSMLTKICEFYLDHGIKFFLFAPSLTCLNGKNTCNRMNHVITDCSIEYENGAIVRTSFVTSYGGDTVAQTEPRLTRLVNAEVDRLRKSKTAQLPKYEYPDHIVTSAMMQRWAKYGVEFAVKRSDCTRVSKLDAQREHGKGIFGSGLLLSERAAAERAAAERAAAERASAHVWELSDRELEIVRRLGGDD